MTKLIIFDMDGVIFEDVNFWIELHKAYGTLEEGLELTKKYLKTNYEKLVKEVIGRLWKHKPAKIYFSLIKKIRYIRGVKEAIAVLKSKNYKMAIVSSGPTDLAKRAQQDLGIDYIYTNHLAIEGHKVAGSTDMRNWPIRFGNKGEIMRKLCSDHNIDYKDCIVVCNEDNDIKMARTAGFAIAFCPVNEEIKKYCNITINKPDLTLILKPIEEFEKKQLII
ncbi:HAD family phosphatase [Candidatus Woesearchaeota archaeon]|nr:HAD family phosphatase [Candidatus Woesearchaeota archaeon]